MLQELYFRFGLVTLLCLLLHVIPLCGPSCSEEAAIIRLQASCPNVLPPTEHPIQPFRIRLRIPVSPLPRSAKGFLHKSWSTGKLLPKSNHYECNMISPEQQCHLLAHLALRSFLSSPNDFPASNNSIHSRRRVTLATSRTPSKSNGSQFQEDSCRPRSLGPSSCSYRRPQRSPFPPSQPQSHNMGSRLQHRRGDVWPSSRSPSAMSIGGV